MVGPHRSHPGWANKLHVLYRNSSNTGQLFGVCMFFPRLHLHGQKYTVRTKTDITVDFQRDNCSFHKSFDYHLFHSGTLHGVESFGGLQNKQGTCLHEKSSTPHQQLPRSVHTGEETLICVLHYVTRAAYERETETQCNM